jgi:DNA-directed RNA polymerase I, II, and III subunit RPABC3
MASGHLLEDSFEVTDIAPKHFARVSRFVCQSDGYDLTLTLDVHAELCSLALRQKFTLTITTSLGDGFPAEAHYHNPEGKPSLLDRSDYAMHGVVFEIDDKSPGYLQVLGSFGGLLMALKGEARYLKRFEVDQKIYLLIRYNKS